MNSATESIARTIIIAATPTPNGDLHVGHMAGPYLAGDVYGRYLKAAGRPVTYSTCTDDSQTYVVSTAHKRGISPQQLCATSTAAIQTSLDAMGISVGTLPPIDHRYRSAVVDFISALHTAGRFALRTVRLPYTEQADTYLVDGLLKGECLVCSAESCGGSCEACGHPNHFDQLKNPRSSMDPTDPVTYRATTVLVLPMEEYRERLVAYYKSHEANWRPHSLQLIREILAKPLPDVPVTYPGDWGVPAPFPETPGQMLYPWVEAMPAAMYSTWWATREEHDGQGAVDALWRAEDKAQVVYFHGFDNVYFWGMVDLVLLMAHGERYVLPRANICNEFYELDHEKFSTSRNHVIWTADLVDEVPRDLARFYLALTCPENERSNFSRQAMGDIVSERLVRPWNSLAERVDELLAGLDPDSVLSVTAAGRERSAAMVQRFRLCYELPNFSLRSAADAITSSLDLLAAVAFTEITSPTGPSLGDLLLLIKTFLAGAAPIMIDLTAAADAAGADLTVNGDSIAPFRLPRLADVNGSTASSRFAHVGH